MKTHGHPPAVVQLELVRGLTSSLFRAGPHASGDGDVSSNFKLQVHISGRLPLLTHFQPGKLYIPCMTQRYAVYDRNRSFSCAILNMVSHFSALQSAQNVLICHIYSPSCDITRERDPKRSVVAIACARSIFELVACPP